MKTIILFLAMISFASLLKAEVCHADFSAVQSDGVVYFVNQSTPVDSFSAFSWSFGDGSTSTLFDPSHVYPSPGYYFVCLTMTNSFLNCSSTICDTLLVDSTNSNSTCSAYFTFTANDNDVLFLNLSSWDSTQATFNWSFGDGNTSTDVNPTHHYNQSGYYYVCLTISTASGCTNYYCNYVNIVDSNCVISFTAQITGNAVFFLPSNANYGTGTFYWTFGDNTTSNEIAPTHHYDQPGNYVACLYYTDSTCTSYTCDSINISSGDSCYAQFYSYEYNGTVSFHPSYIDYSKTYSWDFGDGASSGDVTPYHSYASEGAYEVCLTVSGSNCSATWCDSIYFSNDTTNNNGGYCQAYFEVSDIDTVTSTVWLTDLSDGAVQYFWDFGDSSFSSEQYPSHTYAQNGNYYVCLTITCDSNLTSHYCAWVGLLDSLQGSGNEVRSGFTLNVKPADVSGIVSVPASQTISIYPNPAMESITIALPDGVKGEEIISMKNEVGQLVKQQTIFAGENLSGIDIHSLAPGLYMIQIIAGGKSFSGSLLKQ